MSRWTIWALLTSALIIFETIDNLWRGHSLAVSIWSILTASYWMAVALLAHYWYGRQA